MAERVDLGDNSAKFIVNTTDTIESIESALTAFLNFRGWTLIGSAVNFGASTFTYGSPTMKGGTKRIRLAFFTTGADIYLGISILNELEGDETGFLANLFTSDPLYKYQTFLVKSSVAINLYCFANPRWCYFTSNKVGFLYDINSAYFYAPTEAHFIANSNGYNYKAGRQDIRFTTTKIKVNGKVVSKSIPAEFFTRTSGVIDSIYNHSDIEPLNFNTNDIRSYTFVNETEKLNFSKFSLKGCTEILDTDSPTPFAILDTASLINTLKDEKDIERAIKKELTNTYYKDSKKMLGNSFETTTGVLTTCYLLGDSTEYADINLSVDNFKIDGKNLISAIHTASKNYGYSGKFYGLVLTQANEPTKFLEEKYVRVDENFNPSTNGELRKFFVVPGYSKVFGNWNRRKWNFSANQIKYCFWFGYFDTFDIGRGYDALSYYSRAQMNTLKLPFIGDWQENTSYFETEDCYSFLIPA